MIITCPSCSAQFAVPDGAIPPVGRKVKCAKCSHVWHQKPLEAVADTSAVTPPPASVAPIPEGGNVPALATKDKNRYLKAALWLLLSLSLATNFFLYQHSLTSLMPFLAGVYNSLGLYETEGFSFNDLSAKVERVENHLVVTVDGTLKNENTDTPQTLHPASISLLSEKGNVMDKRAYNEISGTTLEPGGSVPFQHVINDISGNTHTIIVDIQNPVERTFGE